MLTSHSAPSWTTKYKGDRILYSEIRQSSIMMMDLNHLITDCCIAHDRPMALQASTLARMQESSDPQDSIPRLHTLLPVPVTIILYYGNRLPLYPNFSGCPRPAFSFSTSSTDSSTVAQRWFSRPPWIPPALLMTRTQKTFYADS